MGFNGFLFVTVVHPYQLDTTFKIANKFREMDGRQIVWLGTSRLYSLPGGFKTYLAEDILQAKEPGRIEGVGIFRKFQNIYYLEVPKLSAEVLLGRKELK